ncbi:MAG: hypothetical protein HZC39_13650 [Chloroflexi bacterium]|jgi:hypothetical protein|nr:hypothetical protein [Chloroflexota bacterium]MBI5704573.1 hypothetical protein [Chloroflexota bacterium]GER78928.1 conserved hypothetical protein [Candidatus Denitrolinea symbiosum]
MGRTLITITQLLNETEANLSAFRRTLRRSDQYVFDGLLASARRHIAAIGQAESLLPFESALLAMLLEQAKEIAVLQQELDELRKKNSC